MFRCPMNPAPVAIARRAPKRVMEASTPLLSPRLSPAICQNGGGGLSLERRMYAVCSTYSPSSLADTKATPPAARSHSRRVRSFPVPHETTAMMIGLTAPLPHAAITGINTSVRHKCGSNGVVSDHFDTF